MSKGKRTVYIPPYRLSEESEEFNTFRLGLGKVKASKDLEIKIDRDKKIIEFSQKYPSDWVLISGIDLSNWKIYFEGRITNLHQMERKDQRFNKFGLTGCLSVHKSILNKSFFKLNGGDCEDGINIIRSQGSEMSLVVKNTTADALDLDFSNLQVDYLNIKNSGNDCLDISGGKYSVNVASLINCRDKAISVGEKSSFAGNEIIVENSYIGISSKDYSKSFIDNYKSSDVFYCGEVKRKKQEFGGAYLKVGTLECKQGFKVDKESSFKLSSK